MEMCFKILSQEKRVTQRELFYKLLCVSPDCFSSQLQVNRTIQGLFFFFCVLVFAQLREWC
jgi:meiotic recombination protein SPO11